MKYQVKLNGRPNTFSELLFCQSELLLIRNSLLKTRQR